MENNDLDIATRYVALAASAKSREIEFNISFSEFKKIFNKKKCYYSGKKLVKGKNFSFDRADNSKGYVSNNVVACDKSLNNRKTDLTVEEITQIYLGIQKLNKKTSKD